MMSEKTKKTWMKKQKNDKEPENKQESSVEEKK